MDYHEREGSVVDAIKKAIPGSLKSAQVPWSKGLFCELYENNEVFPNHYLACAIDGVGTKVLLAQAMEIYDTIGVDLVAMCANDLATMPKMSPFLFIDYLAIQKKVDAKISHAIVKGISKGLGQCDASKILHNSIKVQFGKGEKIQITTIDVDVLFSHRGKCDMDHIPNLLPRIF